VAGRIETVEALGPETVVKLSLPGSGEEIAARVNIAGSYSAGDAIELHYDARQIQLFDPATTRRIARPVL
jgi:ABC-type sugar transport system ATPase subunit